MIEFQDQRWVTDLLCRSGMVSGTLSRTTSCSVAMLADDQSKLLAALALSHFVATRSGGCAMCSSNPGADILQAAGSFTKQLFRRPDAAPAAPPTNLCPRCAVATSQAIFAILGVLGSARGKAAVSSAALTAISNLCGGRSTYYRCNRAACTFGEY